MKKLLRCTAVLSVLLFAVAANVFGYEVVSGDIHEAFGVFSILSDQSDSDPSSSAGPAAGETGMNQPGETGMMMGPGTGPGMGPGMGHGGFRGPGSSRAAGLIQYLNLTPDQVAKLKELRTRYFMETRDLRYDIAMRRLEMMKLFTDPKASEADLAAKQKELSALYLKKIDRAVQMIIQGRNVLTPEQITKLDMLPIWHRMMGGGRTGGMMGGMMGQRMGGGMMGQGMRGGMMNCPMMGR